MNIYILKDILEYVKVNFKSSEIINLPSNLNELYLYGNISKIEGIYGPVNLKKIIIYIKDRKFTLQFKKIIYKYS